MITNYSYLDYYYYTTITPKLMKNEKYEFQILPPKQIEGICTILSNAPLKKVLICAISRGCLQFLILIFL